MKRRWVVDVAVAITGSLFFVFGSHLAAGSQDEVGCAECDDNEQVWPRFHFQMFPLISWAAGLPVSGDS